MQTRSLPRPRVGRRAMLRGLAAGSAWGLAVAAGLLGLAFYQCGTICLGQILDTASLAVAAGVVAIGPVAAFGRGARE